MQFPTIQENQELQQAVDAKELYQALGLNTAHWAKWHARNIDENPFAAESVDYQTFTQWVRGNETQNYLLSIDFAKKLAMQVRTEMGERIRDYFLECERQLQVKTPSIPQTYADALQLAADQARQLELAKPKITHYDNVVERAGLLNATQVAQKVRLSAVAMNKVLEELGVYNKAVKRSRVFQQWFIDQGFGLLKQTNMGHSQALFTKRGEAWVIERLVSEGVA